MHVCVHITVLVSWPPSTSIHLQCTKNALIFCSPFFSCEYVLFSALNHFLCFFLDVDVITYKSVDMFSTEQLNLMTDSASVDSWSIVYGKRSVILTLGIAAIHNTTLCVHSLCFILPPGSFLIIILPSLLCESSVKHHNTALRLRGPHYRNFISLKSCPSVGWHLGFTMFPICI